MIVLYEWLKDYLGDDAPSVSDIERLLTFHAFEIDGIEEKKDGTLIDVKVLPDRAGDCLSHRGIAHEIGAIVGTGLKMDPLRDTRGSLQVTDRLQMTIGDPLLTRRFSGVLIEKVSIEESPQWLRDRLEALGQRSINNVVDITNYVMLALGAPLHAYDAALLGNKDNTYHLHADRVSSETPITVLGGQEYVLREGVGVIKDATTGAILGIAGIKGGTHAEVTRVTTSIVLEAGNFDPVHIRKTSHLLKLQTDASKRFENNVSPSLIDTALLLASQLIEEIAGGEVIGFAESYPIQKMNEWVNVSLSRTNALLGFEVSVEMVENILKRLSFSFHTEAKNGDHEWRVKAPHERSDIQREVDVIAEIGRIHGYGDLKGVLPNTQVPALFNPHYAVAEKLRELLSQNGFSEILTTSFKKTGNIRLANPFASDKAYLRESLRENLNDALKRNTAHKDLLGLSSIKLFEIGTVFEKTPDDVVESMRLCVGVREKNGNATASDSNQLQQVLSKICSLGVSKDLFDVKDAIAEVDLSKLYETFIVENLSLSQNESLNAVYRPYSLYPSISRDIALWVSRELNAESIARDIQSQGGNDLVRITLFDSFEKNGRISFAFRLVFQSSHRTLTDEDVRLSMNNIEAKLQGKGYEIR